MNSKIQHYNINTLVFCLVTVLNDSVHNVFMFLFNEKQARH